MLSLNGDVTLFVYYKRLVIIDIYRCTAERRMLKLRIIAIMANYTYIFAIMCPKAFNETMILLGLAGYEICFLAELVEPVVLSTWRTGSVGVKESLLSRDPVKVTVGDNVRLLTKTKVNTNTVNAV